MEQTKTEVEHERLLPLWQKGREDPLHFSKFIEALAATGEPRKIAHRFRNPDLDENDVISEWMTQAALAAREALPNIGDPIHFIKWKAKMRTISFIRSFHIRNVVVNCHSCGLAGQRLTRRDGAPSCAACGSGEVTTTRRLVPVDRPIDGNPPLESTLSAQTVQQVADEAIYPVQVEEMRRYLLSRTQGKMTRSIQLFDMIVIHGDRTFTIKKASEEWGVGKVRVVHVMNQLKDRLREYFNKVGS